MELLEHDGDIDTDEDVTELEQPLEMADPDEAPSMAGEPYQAFRSR